MVKASEIANAVAELPEVTPKTYLVGYAVDSVVQQLRALVELEEFLDPTQQRRATMGSDGVLRDSSTGKALDCGGSTSYNHDYW